MGTSQLLTPDQVKRKLRSRGQTITQWARDRGFDPQYVSYVLNGRIKGHRGIAHDIAIALGIKREE